MQVARDEAGDDRRADGEGEVLRVCDPADRVVAERYVAEPSRRSAVTVPSRQMPNRSMPRRMPMMAPDMASAVMAIR